MALVSVNHAQMILFSGSGSIIGRVRNCIPPANQQLTSNLYILLGLASGLTTLRGLKFSRVGHDVAHDIDAANSVLEPLDRRSGPEHCSSLQSVYVYEFAKDLSCLWNGKQRR
jgi:hypothetical protein